MNRQTGFDSQLNVNVTWSVFVCKVKETQWTDISRILKSRWLIWSDYVNSKIEICTIKNTNVKKIGRKLKKRKCDIYEYIYIHVDFFSQTNNKIIYTKFIIMEGNNTKQK